MIRRLIPIVSLVFAAGCEDPTLQARAESLGPDPGPYEAGPLHRAGHPCTWCHAPGGKTGPYFDIAGTVYLHKGSAEAVAGARIHLFDQSGREQVLESNWVGNFFLNEGELTVSYPLWVKVEHQGKTIAMQTPILREKSCSACHLDPASPSSAGHVYVLEEP